MKVLDLGLARFTEDDKASLTVAYDENVLGTADYLAPEQALDSHGVDARADIYSLGCAFYYLLTGQPPSRRDVAAASDDAPEVASAGHHGKTSRCPLRPVDICLKMMAKKPAGRYQSAAEVAEALAEWLLAHGFSCDPIPVLGAPESQGSGKSPVRRTEKRGLPRASAVGSDIARAKRILTEQYAFRKRRQNRLDATSPRTQGAFCAMVSRETAPAVRNPASCGSPNRWKKSQSSLSRRPPPSPSFS